MERNDQGHLNPLLEHPKELLQQLKLLLFGTSTLWYHTSVERPAETQTSIWLARQLVRVLNPKLGVVSSNPQCGHEYGTLITEDLLYFK